MDIIRACYPDCMRPQSSSSITQPAAKTRKLKTKTKAPLADNAESLPRSPAGSRRPKLTSAVEAELSSTLPNAFDTETSEEKRNRLAEILILLRREYPEAKCALHHENPVQLLVATILSAQCTDERVNSVTPALFQKYPDAAAFAAAKGEELEQDIHSTGFFRNKARNIMECCAALVADHGGEVPQEMDVLTTLAGVGRKTANVVRGACFDLPAITVDTHCGRLSRRLGLTTQTDPEKVEEDLQALIPERDWWFFSSAIIRHGRVICESRRPRCHRCVLSGLCPSADIAGALDYEQKRQKGNGVE